MEKRKVNKDNPKNRYCAHCIYWKDVENNPYSRIDDKLYICKKTEKHINYWNCCKDFEFETEGD